MILIYGATGDIGARVARQLKERGPVLLAGRDRRRLESLAAEIGGAEIRVAAAWDTRALERACAEVQVVINCAGPYRVIGAPLLAAAIAGGAHYVDVSGDQRWLRTSYESSESAARRAGVVCVTGLGVEAAVGDWAASLATARLDAESDGDAGGRLDEIAVAYGVSTSRRSLLEDLSEECTVWRHDRWERVAPGSARRRFSFGDRLGEREAVLFPRGEAITLPRHLETRSVETYLWLATENPLLWEATRAAPLVAPLLSPLVAGPLRAFVRSQARSRPKRPSPTGDFAVVAEVSRRFSRARVLVRGRDLSGLSARLAANAAASLTRRPPGPGGMLAPSEAFDARTQLHLLESLGLIEVT